MNWRGKMIGGSIGSFFGPWGALAGAAMGHAFVDRKEAAASEKQALRLLAVTAGALYELAGIDGRYTAREDKAIRAVLGDLNQRLGTRLPLHELAYLIDSSSRIDRSLTRLIPLVRDNRELARAATAWLWRVAVSDADPTPAEQNCVHTFACHAGLSEEEMACAALLYVRAAPRSTSEHARRAACDALSVPYSADAAAVKGAYRAQSLKYHPDKHADLDPDIRALTAEKFAQIKAAYDLLSASESGAFSEHWRVKSPETGRPVPPTTDAVAACFICGQKIRTPPDDQLASARCPVCQTLLALDGDLAEHLAS